MFSRSAFSRSVFSRHPYINSLYPTIKFTLGHSPTSLDVLDLTLSLVDDYIQTDINSKPPDNHIYLLHNSAHPVHCSKAIPYGVATRVRQFFSTYIIIKVAGISHLSGSSNQPLKYKFSCCYQLDNTLGVQTNAQAVEYS